MITKILRQSYIKFLSFLFCYLNVDTDYNLEKIQFLKSFIYLN